MIESAERNKKLRWYERPGYLLQFFGNHLLSVRVTGRLFPLLGLLAHVGWLNRSPLDRLLSLREDGHALLIFVDRVWRNMVILVPSLLLIFHRVDPSRQRSRVLRPVVLSEGVGLGLELVEIIFRNGSLVLGDPVRNVSLSPHL